MERGQKFLHFWSSFPPISTFLFLQNLLTFTQSWKLIETRTKDYYSVFYYKALKWATVKFDHSRFWTTLRPPTTSPASLFTGTKTLKCLRLCWRQPTIGIPTTSCWLLRWGFGAFAVHSLLLYGLLLSENIIRKPFLCCLFLTGLSEISASCLTAKRSLLGFSSRSVRCSRQLTQQWNDFRLYVVDFLKSQSFETSLEAGRTGNQLANWVHRKTALRLY